MMDETSKVTITRDHYEQLERRSQRLACLEDWGVDNWEGYSDALREGGYWDDEDEE